MTIGYDMHKPKMGGVTLSCSTPFYQYLFRHYTYMALAKWREKLEAKHRVNIRVNTKYLYQE